MGEATRSGEPDVAQHNQQCDFQKFATTTCFDIVVGCCGQCWIRIACGRNPEHHPAHSMLLSLPQCHRLGARPLAASGADAIGLPLLPPGGLHFRPSTLTNSLPVSLFVGWLARLAGSLACRRLSWLSGRLLACCRWLSCRFWLATAASSTRDAARCSPPAACHRLAL
eukprot:SAG31_NODE_186_length_20918_cov_26.890917_11_plen_168_part_00